MKAKRSSRMVIIISDLLMLLFILIDAGLAESSYSGGSTTTSTSNYEEDQIRRMSLIKASHLNNVRQLNSAPTPPLIINRRSRVYHVTDYGADPTGQWDSTEAVQRALSDALFLSPINKSHLMQGVSDLGGSQLHLDGGTYIISRPLRLPHDISVGNFMIHGGSLRASNTFPIDRHLIELSPSPSSHEDITLKDLMINCNFRGGGISVVDSVRTTIDNCYISHFTTHAILIQGGHETFVRNSFIGQYINIGGDHREQHFSGIGVKIMGNDNALTDVVIFSAQIGVMVLGQANVLTGVHCYNKATALGGTGIYVGSPGLTQTRILNCYFDFTGVVAEDPVQLQISGSFFLGNAYVLIKSLDGVVSGVNVVDNMFSGDYTGVHIVQLDQSHSPFTRIDQVVVDRNNVRGMVLKSTVAKESRWGNGTTWTVDFSRVLLFPKLIKNVQYTMQAGGASVFFNHMLRNVSENQVTVESDVPVSATLHVSVDQTMISYV